MFPATPNASAGKYSTRVQSTWPRIALLTTTGASTWIVPDGVTKVRAYAFGSGGSGSSQSGGGGGCAYGDITVFPGQAIRTKIATADSGTTDTLFGTWLRAGPASTDGTNNRLGGTAWIDGSVQNGGAYAGGNGVAGAGGGASSGSPLGVGVGGAGGCGGSGWGGAGSGGGGGVGSASMSGYGNSGGAWANQKSAPPGGYTDPLLALCNAAGVSGFGISGVPNFEVAVRAPNGGMGAGGAVGANALGPYTPQAGGHGGLGGGGGRSGSGGVGAADGGYGGLGGGGGQSVSSTAGNAGGSDYAGGGGWNAGSTTAPGGQGCIIVFY